MDLSALHYDKVQSNGILRALDFDEMMKRHSNERGIWWSLVLVNFPGDGTFGTQPPRSWDPSAKDGNFNGIEKGSWVVDKDVLDDIVQTK